eukprot:TRINITY_DN514_c0_g1_i1.p1 TRINITY_DN514_c0_g1~~TRINITY_DN514_c0_g1_i1.p1  ORF type:complete len:140 (+),score=31.45 TRINITY_DN514_c0_g1_i1:19-438(+)
MSFRGSDSENEEIELASTGPYDDDSVAFLSKDKRPRGEDKKKRRGIVLIASSVVAFLVLIGVIIILATINRAVVAAEKKEKEELANYAAAANATLSRMDLYELEQHTPCIFLLPNLKLRMKLGKPVRRFLSVRMWWLDC